MKLLIISLTLATFIAFVFVIYPRRKPHENKKEQNEEETTESAQVSAQDLQALKSENKKMSDQINSSNSKFKAMHAKMQEYETNFKQLVGMLSDGPSEEQHQPQQPRQRTQEQHPQYAEEEEDVEKEDPGLDAAFSNLSFPSPDSRQEKQRQSSRAKSKTKGVRFANHEEPSRGEREEESDYDDLVDQFPPAKRGRAIEVSPRS